MGFSLRKLNDTGADVKTSPNSSQVDNIRILYGNAVAKELLKFEVQEVSLKFKG